MTNVQASSTWLIACIALAGCTTDPIAPTSCDPPCAGNTMCDPVTNTCVAGMTDLGATVDLITTCSPACSAPTPLCDAKGKCVACLKDADCPIGNICKSGVLGTS